MLQRRPGDPVSRVVPVFDFSPDAPGPDPPEQGGPGGQFSVTKVRRSSEKPSGASESSRGHVLPSLGPVRLVKASRKCRDVLRAYEPKSMYFV
jgi:hypothetical protein